MILSKKQKLVLLPFVLIYLILSISSASKGGDFDVYLDAASKLSTGQNIYTPPFWEGLQYYYSPLFAIILIPFTGNFFVIELIWLLISGFFLFRIAVLVRNYFDFSYVQQKHIYWLLGITFLILIRFILYNITMIQITFFLLWAILESISLIKKDKWILGGLLLALAINIKLMPIVFVPYLIYRGYFKSLIAILVFSILFLLLPSLFIGHDENLFLLSEWGKIINPSNSEHLIEVENYSQSLVGIIPVYITETIGEIDLKRNIINLSAESAKTITNIVRICLVLLTLFFIGKPFKKSVGNLSEIRAIAYICLIVPLIFPHQQKYAFFFTYPAIFYITHYVLLQLRAKPIKSKFKVFLIYLILIALSFSPLIGSDVIGRYNYDLFHFYRILGISALLIIPALIIITPKKINELEQERKNQLK